MKSLYDLITEHAKLSAALLSAEELTDEQLAEIASIEGSIEDKCTGTYAISKGFEIDAEVLRKQAKELAEMAGKREALSKRLRTNMVRLLDMAGIESVRTDMGLIKVQEASRPSIRWEGDIADIPLGLQRVKVELDGDKVYQTWKAGELPAGFVAVKSRGIRVY